MSLEKAFVRIKNNFDFEAPVQNTIKELKARGKELDVHDIDTTTVRELLHSHSKDLSDDDIIEVEQQQAYDESDETNA